jgi:hypothetical protein
MQLDLNALARGLRHVVHFEELAAALRKGLSRPGERTAPLVHLQLQGCGSLDADALALLLATVPTLHSLDVSRCPSIGDAAVRALALHDPAAGALAEAAEDLALQVCSHACMRGMRAPRETPRACRRQATARAGWLERREGTAVACLRSRRGGCSPLAARSASRPLSPRSCASMLQSGVTQTMPR